MRTRTYSLGSKNQVGHRIETLRKEKGLKQKHLLAQLQVKGIGLTASGLSKIEGQFRMVTDYELLAFSEILNVSVKWLLTGQN